MEYKLGLKEFYNYFEYFIVIYAQNFVKLFLIVSFKSFYQYFDTNISFYFKKSPQNKDCKSH